MIRHAVFNEFHFPFKSDPSFKVLKGDPNHDFVTPHFPMVARLESPPVDKTPLSVDQATDFPLGLFMTQQQL